MPIGFMLLKYLAYRVSSLETVCRRCDRHRVYATSMLMVRHGGYVSIPELKDIVAADCPNRQATGSSDVCQIHFPQIETPWGAISDHAHTDTDTAAVLSLDPKGFAPERSKDLVMSSIAPVWDGNETWLILGGVGLLAVFPLAFAIIIPAVYFPALAMLLGLVFRDVAFEFRFKQLRIRRFWNNGFCVGSAVAAFSQGAVLGALIQGFKVDGRNFAGTSFD